MLGPAAEIVLLECGSRLGGCLRTVELAGPVDVGAEAFVGRRPEVPELLAELGLAEQLVHPSGLRPSIWADGVLHPLPAGTLMGLPAGPDAVAGLVDAGTLARIAAEPARPLRWVVGGDTDLASLVADRFGAQVVARSVDPLLGGVYAGRSATIGVRAALPALAARLDAGAASLSAAVAAALPPPSDRPVFGGVRDGYGVLLDALRRAAAATECRAPFVGLSRDGAGWQVDPVGRVDGVLLAVPAPAAADLLRGVAPVAAAAAAAIPSASSAVVALAVPADSPLPPNSGILIGTGEPVGAKAFTFSSRKWPHLRGRQLAGRSVALLRASFGRYGDDAVLARSNPELVATAVADLATVTGVTVTPLAVHVQRWPAALPQYRPGHAGLVAAIESSVAELAGLEVAGAYLGGVGVPACVAAGSAAAHRLMAR